MIMTICSVRMYNIYLWEHPFLAHWSTAAEALKEPAAIKNLWKIILIFYSLASLNFHQSHCLQLTWKRTPFLNLKFCPMMLVMLEGLMEKGMAMYASFKM